jgi:hypothetical protein
LRSANVALKASERASHDVAVTAELISRTLRAFVDNFSTTALAKGRYASSSTIVIKVRPEPESERTSMGFDDGRAAEISLIVLPVPEGNGTSPLSLHIDHKPRSFEELP